MKKAISLLLLILFCIGIGKGLYWAKKGFTLRRIAAPFSVELNRWSDEANLAILQPFRYLGRGRQCFAFESLDGKYVLKLPRTDIYQTSFRSAVCPLFSNEAKAVARATQGTFISESMRIAFDELQEETGTLAVHLGQTADLGVQIKISDALGYPYHIPLSKTSFVLQRKQPILMKCFLEGDPAKKEKVLDALLDLVCSRGKKGIWNRDESFLRNYGFDGEKGYQIDIGSFYHKPDAEAGVRDTCHPIKSWLAKNDPLMLPYFEEVLEGKITSSELESTE
jgi:hypothetical protein